MLRRKSASTYSRHIGANGRTAAKLISLSFILVVCRQLFLLCLLLGEETRFHCSLCRIGFCFQQFFEPGDICLDDPSHIELPFPPQRETGNIPSILRVRKSQWTMVQCGTPLQVRFGSKSDILHDACPFYPRKRTSARSCPLRARTDLAKPYLA
jgi:hypothetical protein